MRNRSWLPLYVGDYLSDTRDLKPIEHGAYLLLIMHYWQHGVPLPDHAPTLQRITGLTYRQWYRHWPNIQRFFKFGELLHANVDQGPKANATPQIVGCWYHKRLDEELRKAEEIKIKRALAGQRGGWTNRGKSNWERHLGKVNRIAIAKQTVALPQPHIGKGEVAEEEKATEVSSELEDITKRKGWTQ
jgi:uncharacterized protein YdaU (DUF1376 family)